MKMQGCASCGEKYYGGRLSPYCSIVCRVLGQAGLGWRLYPYRIVDLKSGVVLVTGPSFDVTPKGLAKLQKKAEALHQAGFEETKVAPTPPMPAYILEKILEAKRSLVACAAS